MPQRLHPHTSSVITVRQTENRHSFFPRLKSKPLVMLHFLESKKPKQVITTVHLFHASRSANFPWPSWPSNVPHNQLSSGLCMRVKDWPNVSDINSHSNSYVSATHVYVSQIRKQPENLLQNSCISMYVIVYDVFQSQYNS